MIHTGTNYLHSTGCLLTIGTNYSKSEKTIEKNDEIKKVTVYSSNGTSTNTLKLINDYYDKKQNEAFNDKKDLKMIINIYR